MMSTFNGANTGLNCGHPPRDVHIDVQLTAVSNLNEVTMDRCRTNLFITLIFLLLLKVLMKSGDALLRGQAVSDCDGVVCRTIILQTVEIFIPDIMMLFKIKLSERAWSDNAVGEGVLWSGMDGSRRIQFVCYIFNWAQPIRRCEYASSEITECCD